MYNIIMYTKQTYTNRINYLVNRGRARLAFELIIRPINDDS